MTMHPMGDPGETLTDPRDQMIAALRHITAEQLRHLGTHQVVYLKAGTCDGEQAFAVFGADGIPSCGGRCRRDSGGDGCRTRPRFCHRPLSGRDCQCR